MRFLKNIFVFVLATFIIATAYAERISEIKIRKQTHFETGWLKVENGYIGSVLGAEVKSVTPLENDKLSRIEVVLPQAKGRSIEEVVVVGKRNEADYHVELDKPITFIEDYEEGRSGIVIHLGEKMPFKLLINYVEYKHDTINN